MQRPARSAAAFAAALALGCGTAPTAEVADMTIEPDLAGDMKAPGYPAGPYGNDVGDTLPNLTFKGYFNPTATTGLSKTQKFGEVTFDMLRTSGAKYGLLMLAGYT